MTTKTIPVTFDFFKKYTYHEECVESLIKLKANGDQQLYERLMDSQEAQERALKAYYEAFYLRPKIREKYHIRFKSAPKKIKDKLLSIPMQDIGTTSNIVEEQNKEQDVTEIYIQDVVKDLDSTERNVDTSTIRNDKLEPRNRILLTTQSVFEGDCAVDDDEPICSPENPNDKISIKTVVSKSAPDSRKTSKSIEKEEKNIERNESCNKVPLAKKTLNKNILAKDDMAKEIHNKNGVIEESDKADVKNLHQINENIASSNKNSNFNYKALTPFLHCCPLSLKKFRKYSNIDKLVAEFCKLKNMDERTVLHRSHLLFYLAPEYRNLPPINEIQLSDNCPLVIKKKFFSVPENLYLKDKHNKKEPTEAKNQLESDQQLNNNKVTQKPGSSKTDNQLTESVALNEEIVRIIVTKTITADSAQSSSMAQNCLAAGSDVNVHQGPGSSPLFQQKSVSAVKAVTFDVNKEQNNKNSHKFTTSEKNSPRKCITTSENMNSQKKAVQSGHVIQQNIKTVAKTVTFDVRDESNKTTQQLQTPKIDSIQQNNCEHKSTDKQTNNITTPNSVQMNNNKPPFCLEPNNNIKKKETSSLPTSANDMIIKFPVSLSEFKKQTHYEEIVEKLFKLKTQDNEELFLKYKNCKKVFDETLMKYYRAFYLLPAIREIWPIRLKPMPRYKRNLLLQIPEGVIMAPLNDFTAKQLILPDEKTVDVNEKESSAEQITVTKPVEEQPMETETSSSSDTEMAATVIKSKSENLDSNKSLKRPPSNEAVQSASPKRQKIEQNSDYTKKSYKELLPYEHCCPVSFADFTKYSNITELFTGYCQKRYNSTKKLPYMLKRAYILYYLEPEYRNLKPFNKLQVLDECPLNVKERIFDIPTNLVKEEKNNISTVEKVSTETEEQHKSEDVEVAKENNQQKTISQKPIIEILENRLLPPIKHPISEQSNWEGILCLDNSCVFYHTTYTDIKKHTNIPTVQTGPMETTVLQNIFKKLIYEIVYGQSCDEKYVFNPILVCKIFKHKMICDKCKHEVQTLLNLGMPATHDANSEGDRTFNTSTETVIARRELNNESPKTANVEDLESATQMALDKRKKNSVEIEIAETQSVNMEIGSIEKRPIITETSAAAEIRTSSEKSSEAASIENQGKSKDPLAEIARIEKPSTKDMTMEKSSSTKPPKNLGNDVQTQQVTTEIKMIDVFKNERLFSKFCQKLLAKLEQSLDGTIDFSSETYKMFLECNEIPFPLLLKDFCENNDDYLQRILNKTELLKALQRYYYFKYLTNKDFALKYPVKVLKENCNETHENNAKQATEKDTRNSVDLEKTNQNLDSSSGGNSLLLNSITIHDETVKNLSLNQEKPSSNNSALEKAKRIFFRNVDKTHTLAYVLRTTFGYKHIILRNILNLTFNEFLELTHVYEGKELYDNKHLAECMYRYVCQTPLVWPTNLFISLDNLCEFLHKKNIHFDNYSTMLFYISPKLLHWSNLLSCTNILDCVKCDYEKRTGKILDTDDISSLKQECIEYYNRCWKHEKWVADTPLVNEEFCKRFSKDNNEDVAMAEQPTTICSCKDPDQVAISDKEANNLHAANCVSDIIVLSPSDINRSVTNEQDPNEFNCVLLPSTQKQIELLPAEQIVSNDPLNNTSKSPIHLNVSQSSQESCEVETIGELIQPIKSEPVDKKLLSNLFFYEDDKNEMQCVTCEEEIVELDTTLQQSQITRESLPPSQIDFDVLLSSEDLQSLLGQHLPSSAESNAVNKQQSLQTSLQPGQNILEQLIHFPDVSLLSSGENPNNNEQQPNMNLQDCQGLEPALVEILRSSSEESCGAPQVHSVHQEAQRLPSSFEETQTSNDSSVKPQQQEFNKTPQKTIKQVIDSILKGKRQEDSTTDKQIEPSTSKASCKSSYQTNQRKPGLPKLAGITNSKVATKNKNNVATVKPLQNSSLVPQIQHNTRPLQTVPAFSASNGSKKQAQTMESQVVAPTSFTLNLTPTNSQNSTGQSSQNSGIQLQLPNCGTHIFISQELNKNCSVFDNSSLLRIVDHNYHKESTTNLTQTINSEQQPTVGNTQQQTEEEVTRPRNSSCADNNTLANDERNQNNEQPMDKANVRPTCRITRKNSQCFPNCSQPNTKSNLFKISNTIDNQKPQACRRIITRRLSNLCKDTNDKVNDSTLTTPNNVVTSITITINQQPLPQPLHPPVQQHLQMIRKVFLHRCISKFHYFKELTPQHMSRYLLPSLQIGKSYSEALIVCENFKTRISNRSISNLFPYWSQNLQRDFLLVLNDLKEFHYNVFERKSLQKQEDLRARVLFWLLDTAPSFSFCQFVYERNNSEFSHCEAIKSANDPSYKRKPFKCLTNALNSKILKKLKEVKSDLKEKKKNNNLI